MASAWGSGWGSAWGDSWGAVGAAPAAPAQEIDYGAGSGRWKGKPRDWKKEKREELRRILEVLGEEIETAPQVAKIKAEHSRIRNAEPVWDIASLVADIQAMQWLMQAYENHLLQKALEDDEDAFLLMM